MHTRYTQLSLGIQRVAHRLLHVVFPESAAAARIAHWKEHSIPPQFFRAQTALATHNAIFAPLAYAHPEVRELIYELKYRNNDVAAHVAATLLYDILLGDIGDSALFQESDLPLIAPIPLTKKRERERGYNQSARIVTKIIQRDHGESLIPAPLLLEKIRDTEPQTKLSHAERQTNLTGCFRVINANAALGRTVYLIDDVTTTGATFTEARRVLLLAGARTVVCYAVAH